MEKLEIEGTDATPHITCDASAGKIVFIGRSIPENATSFYSPVIAWIKEYSKSPIDRTELAFNLDYINSISQKLLLDILYRLEEMTKANGNVVHVTWRFESDDDQMRNEGEVFASKVDLNFELDPVDGNQF